MGSELISRCVDISMPPIFSNEIMKTAIWEHPPCHFLLCIQWHGCYRQPKFRKFPGHKKKKKKGGIYLLQIEIFDCKIIWMKKGAPVSFLPAWNEMGTQKKSQESNIMVRNTTYCSWTSKLAKYPSKLRKIYVGWKKKLELWDHAYTRKWIIQEKQKGPMPGICSGFFPLFFALFYFIYLYLFFKKLFYFLIWIECECHEKKK